MNVDGFQSGLLSGNLVFPATLELDDLTFLYGSGCGFQVDFSVLGPPPSAS